MLYIYIVQNTYIIVINPLTSSKAIPMLFNNDVEQGGGSAEKLCEGRTVKHLYTIVSESL